MATGKQRLEDIHKGKRKEKEAQIAKIMEMLDPPEPKTKNRAKSPKITPFRKVNKVINGLSDSEKEYFANIMDELKKIHPDEHGKFSLAAASLASLYVQQDILETQIDETGGYILEDANGRFYQNPAAVMLQRVQNTIIRNLGILGLTMGKKQVKENTQATNLQSEFANFQ